MITTLNAATMMKAIVCPAPGPAARLRIQEVSRPPLADDAVLVRVRASSANPVDLFPMSRVGYLSSRTRPLVLGTDFAGTVEMTGKNVTEFHVGDEVFGGAQGAFAEYLAVAERKAIAHKPHSVPFELAGAAAVAGTTALQALRDHGRLRSGQRVLVNGASGGVGTFTVQIAKALGAHVTAVCSTRNLDMVRSLGADEVIDYTRSDFTRGARRYDLIVDIAGTHPLRECRRVLEPSGRFVGVGAAGVQHQRAGTIRAFGHFIATRIARIGARERVVSLFIASLNQGDLRFLAELMEAGSLVPGIDRRFGFAEIPAALEYLNEGHARAKIAIAVGDA